MAQVERFRDTALENNQEMVRDVSNNMQSPLQPINENFDPQKPSAKNMAPGLGDLSDQYWRGRCDYAALDNWAFDQACVHEKLVRSPNVGHETNNASGAGVFSQSNQQQQFRSPMPTNSHQQRIQHTPNGVPGVVRVSTPYTPPSLPAGAPQVISPQIEQALLKRSGKIGSKAQTPPKKHEGSFFQSIKKWFKSDAKKRKVNNVRLRLGISLASSEVEPGKRKHFVNWLFEDGAAIRTEKIQIGDEVISINGKYLAAINDAQGMKTLFASAQDKADSLFLGISRHGHQMQVMVPLFGALDMGATKFSDYEHVAMRPSSNSPSCEGHGGDGEGGAARRKKKRKEERGDAIAQLSNMQLRTRQQGRDDNDPPPPPPYPPPPLDSPPLASSSTAHENGKDGGGEKEPETRGREDDKTPAEWCGENPERWA